MFIDAIIMSEMNGNILLSSVFFILKKLLITINNIPVNRGYINNNRISNVFRFKIKLQKAENQRSLK